MTTQTTVTIKGLGPDEEVVETIDFDGEQWVVIKHQRLIEPAAEVETDDGESVVIPAVSGPEHYRTAYVWREAKDGESTLTYRPIINGRLRLVEIRSHSSGDRKTRQLGADQTEASYTVRYEPSNGEPARTTTITMTELNNTSRDPAWMTRLGIDAQVRTKKYGDVRELIKAVNWHYRASGRRVQIIPASGIWFIGGRMYYATPAGPVIGPTGKLDGYLCQPKHITNHHRAITYPSRADFTPKQARDGLDALEDLIMNGYPRDRGLGAILGGQTIAALMAGTNLKTSDGLDLGPAASVAAIIGLSEQGKTAYAMLHFTGQTRTLSGEVEPDVRASITPGKGSGGTTPRGIQEHTADFGSGLMLLDDVIKAIASGWSVADQIDAHNKILDPVTCGVLGGAAMQAQPDPRGGTKPRDLPYFPASVVFTMESTGPYVSLIKDAIFNRMALVWWNIENRCDLDTFNRLTSQEHTARRNTGLAACLALLLKRPEVLSDGYVKALAWLRGADRGQPRLAHERTAKAYARALMGLYVLDEARAEFGGKRSGLLARLQPAALKHAQRLEDSGTDGGDELAISDLLEAFRESVRIARLTDLSIYASGPPDPHDEGKPVIPQPPEPEHLPAGSDLTSAGWYPNGAEGWQHKPNASHVGAVYPQRKGGRGRTFNFTLQATGDQFDTLWQEVQRISQRQHFTTANRNVTRDRLEAAGVLVRVKINNKWVYQFDWTWLTARPHDGEAEGTNNEDRS